MTEKRQDTNQLIEAGPEKDTLERLFKFAAPRPLPPEEDERFVREALHAEWDQLMGRRRRRQRVTRWAMAASVLIFVGAVVLTVGPGLMEPPKIAAHIDRVRGEIQVSDDGKAWRKLPAAAEELNVDQMLKTPADSQVAIRLASGGALRLDHSSQIRLMGDGEVELTKGALYFDSRNDHGPKGEIKVSTEFGSVRNHGTMFTARVSTSALDVRVREGEVSISGGPHRLKQGSGKRIVLPSSGPAQVTNIDIHGPEWGWVEEIAPSFDIKGRGLVNFLEWVARETGRELSYESPEVKRIAYATDVRGFTKIEMEPLSALRAVLATTDLEYEVQDGVIVISR